MRYEKDKKFKTIYVGGISKDRGIYVMIESMKYLKNKNIELNILDEVGYKNIMTLFNSSEKIK